MIEKLKKHFKKLREDLKPMSFPDKLDHLWTYYKEVLFTALMVVMVLCIVITGIVNVNRQTLTYGVLVNVSSSVEGYGYLTDSLFTEYGGKEKRQEVVLDSVVFEDPELAQDVRMNYNASMRLLGLVTAKMVDYLLMDTYSLEFYIADEFYMDLEELFSPEELEQLQDRIIYGQAEGTQERIPVAVDVSELPFIKENIRTKDKVYLTFAANTERPEACRKLWQWINSWEPSLQ